MILGFIPRGRHLFAYDVIVTALAIAIAFAMRFDVNDITATMAPYLPAALLPIVTYPPVYVAFGLYRREWRYASVREMFAIGAAVLLGTGVTIGVFLLMAEADLPGTEGFPRSIFFIEGLLNLALVGGGRFLLRASLDRGQAAGPDENAVLTLVYGAGEAGATVARLAMRDPAAKIHIVGFLDDDPQKHGLRMLGRRVFGGLDQLDVAVSRTGAERLLVAMPSATGHAIRRAFDAGLGLGLDVRTVPPLRELVTGEVQLSKIRPVRVDDLLRRESVSIDSAKVAAALNGSSVVVTGGGGSIGGELVRQILAMGPRILTIIDNHEWALWSIEREVADLGVLAGGAHVEAILADVRSPESMEGIIRRAKPDVVFHAAALKHVPMVERFPIEGAHTNVLGTNNLLRACEGAGVGRFILISTDKAVEPTSAMGATKRIAELLTQAAARRSHMTYSAVRFGNVLGSSGSVVPTFERQLAAGQPLTVTHRDATRYFMTIGEAVSLILETAAAAEPGEIYVLDMGEPIRVLDLARDLVRLAGLDPDVVEFTFTGLRPGERLHETLFYESERAERTQHEGIFRAKTPTAAPADGALDAFVADLSRAVHDRDELEVRALMRRVEEGSFAMGAEMQTS